jgi:hypothetical protein
MRTLSVALTLGLVALAPPPARAYRPFDQTDADVAKPREFELELGPLAGAHAAGGNWLTPGFVFNYGLLPRWELVLADRNVVRAHAPATTTAPASKFETALLAKTVLRQGCLQGRSGLSVALESGVLLPTLPEPARFGAAATLIVSQRWSNAALHIDTELDLTRERHGAFVVGAIVEGPDAWKLRPVAETFVAKDGGGPTAVSGLVGSIWRVHEDVALDGALRVAHEDARAVIELRLGLTWTFAL